MASKWLNRQIYNYVGIFITCLSMNTLAHLSHYKNISYIEMAYKQKCITYRPKYWEGQDSGAGRFSVCFLAHRCCLCIVFSSSGRGEGAVWDLFFIKAPNPVMRTPLSHHNHLPKPNHIWD